jgi:hypothetical protein
VRCGARKKWPHPPDQWGQKLKFCRYSGNRGGRCSSSKGECRMKNLTHSRLGTESLLRARKSFQPQHKARGTDIYIRPGLSLQEVPGGIAWQLIDCLPQDRQRQPMLVHHQTHRFPGSVPQDGIYHSLTDSGAEAPIMRSRRGTESAGRSGRWNGSYPINSKTDGVRQLSLLGGDLSTR